MAVEMAESDQKWLLINVQHHEEFSSHMLNRDTWCDDTVEQIVRKDMLDPFTEPPSQLREKDIIKLRVEGTGFAAKTDEKQLKVSAVQSAAPRF